MILSAALDSGYVFMALVAILTSVISAAYYLNLIKEIFFFKSEYSINPSIINIKSYITPHSITKPLVIETSNKEIKKDKYTKPVETYDSNITLNSSLTTLISVLTLILLFFIYIPEEWFNLVNIITLILFKS